MDGPGISDVIMDSLEAGLDDETIVTELRKRFGMVRSDALMAIAVESGEAPNGDIVMQHEPQEL